MDARKPSLMEDSAPGLTPNVGVLIPLDHSHLSHEHPRPATGLTTKSSNLQRMQTLESFHHLRLQVLQHPRRQHRRPRHQPPRLQVARVGHILHASVHARLSVELHSMCVRVFAMQIALSQRRHRHQLQRRLLHHLLQLHQLIALEVPYQLASVGVQQHLRCLLFVWSVARRSVHQRRQRQKHRHLECVAMRTAQPWPLA